MIDGFINRLENLLNTEEYILKNKTNTSHLTRLQKMDRYPLLSTISGLARIILSTLYFVVTSFKGDPLKGFKQFVIGVSRGAFVSVPFFGNFIAIVLDRETMHEAYTKKPT